MNISEINFFSKLKKSHLQREINLLNTKLNNIKCEEIYYNANNLKVDSVTLDKPFTDYDFLLIETHTNSEIYTSLVKSTDIKAQYYPCIAEYYYTANDYYTCATRFINIDNQSFNVDYNFNNVNWIVKPYKIYGINLFN